MNSRKVSSLINNELLKLRAEFPKVEILVDQFHKDFDSVFILDLNSYEKLSKSGQVALVRAMDRSLGYLDKKGIKVSLRLEYR